MGRAGCTLVGSAFAGAAARGDWVGPPAGAVLHPCRSSHVSTEGPSPLPLPAVAAIRMLCFHFLFPLRPPRASNSAGRMRLPATHPAQHGPASGAGTVCLPACLPITYICARTCGQTYGVTFAAVMRCMPIRLPAEK